MKIMTVKRKHAFTVYMIDALCLQLSAPDSLSLHDEIDRSKRRPQLLAKTWQFLVQVLTDLTSVVSNIPPFMLLPLEQSRHFRAHLFSDSIIIRQYNFMKTDVPCLKELLYVRSIKGIQNVSISSFRNLERLLNAQKKRHVSVSFAPSPKCENHAIPQAIRERNTPLISTALICQAKSIETRSPNGGKRYDLQPTRRCRIFIWTVCQSGKTSPKHRRDRSMQSRPNTWSSAKTGLSHHHIERWIISIFSWTPGGHSYHCWNCDCPDLQSENSSKNIRKLADSVHCFTSIRISWLNTAHRHCIGVSPYHRQQFLLFLTRDHILEYPDPVVTKEVWVWRFHRSYKLRRWTWQELPVKAVKSFLKEFTWNSSTL